MTVGLLVFINFLSVPVLFEVEELSKDHQRLPKLSEVLRFHKVRKSRWLLAYGILMTLVLLLALAPTASGKIYVASLEMIAGLAFIQAILWLIMIARIKLPNLNKRRKNDDKF